MITMITASVHLQIVEPTNVYRLHAKRVVAWRKEGEPNPQRDCPAHPNGHAFHNADWLVEDRETDREVIFGPPDRNDPRWPKSCTCGYVFREDDDWLFYGERLWRTEAGKQYELDEVPLGSAWHAFWMPRGEENTLWSGPDGQCLVVRTPHGDWWVDGPSAQTPTSRGWQRLGTLPKITVTPSIVLGAHEWSIVNGELFMR